ncbi:ribonuclease H-like domain-containing protein [Tanacetum coccineum]
MWASASIMVNLAHHRTLMVLALDVKKREVNLVDQVDFGNNVLKKLPMLHSRLHYAHLSEAESHMVIKEKSCDPGIANLWHDQLGHPESTMMKRIIERPSPLKVEKESLVFLKRIQETTQTNVAAKLSLPKQGEYEMWRLRIEQYFQIQDYALWDVIENDNSFKPTARTTANADDLETMSFDDLYNNFKIVEQEVKRTGTSSSNSSSQNMAFVSTPGSTNEANTVNVQVSTANSSVSTDSTLDSTANLSDATVYAFLANQPNGSQLVHEDLEQIHEDDLEEMDLKWQLALLSMRARKYYQRTGKKITINGSDTAGYDKSKVECFNCHKMGHFARECRGPRNQESRPRNQDSSRRTVNVEDTSSKAMVAIDGAGFDWSFMAEEEVTTNMALMAFSDSEVYNDKTCSNTCLKSFEALKTQLDNLRVEFNKSEFNLATYKRGLASVEEQLVFYKKNEVMFCDQIVVLKRDASFKDSEINACKIEIESLRNEKKAIR